MLCLSKRVGSSEGVIVTEKEKKRKKEREKKRETGNSREREMGLKHLPLLKVLTKV